MTRIAIVVLALATLTTGCASMGTKRGPGGQIQRTAEPAEPTIGGQLDGRPELGQR